MIYVTLLCMSKTPIILGIDPGTQILGFAVLKGASFLKDNVAALTQGITGNVFHNWEINLDYHFGGYAKIDDHLLDFVDKF